MKITHEFKEFISRGNVVDLAIGVIIGGAFGKIVDSLVKDVVMPPISFLLSGVDVSSWKYTIVHAASVPDPHDPTKLIARPAVDLTYGNFLQASLNFLIISAVIFFVVKFIHKLKHEAPPAPPEPTAEEKLLVEIRDLLAQKKT